MTVSEIIKELDFQVLNMASNKDLTVSGIYCGDLLSDVMANAEPDSLWLTVQGHINILAVALLRDLAAVVLVNGAKADSQTLERAKEKEITLLSSKDSAATICMKFAKLAKDSE